MALQMNVSGIRRNLKNIAHNYTDAQVKVREATSNDPWGASSTLMSEIADLTYNVVAFSEIMQMIWKRLNDHGRYWRHVYKALGLLEYLIKTGSEKVADQCKENIFAIQTLKDFQYVEENKDMGVNVREKAKTLVALLKDEERLRNERVRAIKAKERFTQSLSGIGSETDINSPSSPSYPNTYPSSSSRNEREPYSTMSVPSNSAIENVPNISNNQVPPIGFGEQPSNNSELETARPQTVGEEELQLQLALAMSKEEAEQEEARRKSDDVRLQLAISQSESDYTEAPPEEDKSALNDLLDINFNPNGASGGGATAVPPSTMSPSITSNSGVDPWGMNLGAAPSPPPVSPQHLPSQQKQDPWSATTSGPSSRVTSPPITNDPWAPVPSMSPEPDCTGDAFDLSDMSRNLENNDEYSSRPKSKSPAAFLGENSGLVNLDNLVSKKTSVPGIGAAATTSPNLKSIGMSNNNYFSSSLTLGASGNYNNSLQSTSLTSSYIRNPSNVDIITTTSAPLSMPNSNNPFFSGDTSSINTQPSPSLVAGVNPFGGPSPINPFQAQQTKPSLNQMRTLVGAPSNQQHFLGADSNNGGSSPWMPQGSSATSDPFPL